MSDENENLSPSKNEKSIKEVVVIKVADPNGQILSFKVKKLAPLSKLFAAYCEKQGLDQESVRFFFDGTRISGTDTPFKLQIENDDVIEVYTQQTGGNINLIARQFSSKIVKESLQRMKFSLDCLFK